jgi:hypothetical protein
MAEKKTTKHDPTWSGYDFDPEPGTREPGPDSDEAYTRRIASINAAVESESEAARRNSAGTLDPDHGR